MCVRSMSSHFVNRCEYFVTNCAGGWVRKMDVFHVSSNLCRTFEANWAFSFSSWKSCTLAKYKHASYQDSIYYE